MADQYYNNVQFALSLNGDYTDWSKYNRLVTIDSGITMSTSVTKYSSYSAYFPPALSRTMMIEYLNWSSNITEYTFECWIYAIKSSSPTNVFLIGQFRDSNNYWKLYINSINNDLVLISSTGTIITAPVGYANKWDVWTHITLVQQNVTTFIYLNGQLLASGTFNFPSINEPILIGGLQHSGTTEFFVGYLSDVRFTKGICRYTTNFNVPTQLMELDSLKSIVLQAIDEISGILPQCDFDVHVVGSGNVVNYTSNSYGNITIKVPDNISVEISAYANNYKKARIESNSFPPVTTIKLNRIINSNLDTIQQLLPLIYFSSENDLTGVLNNDGIGGGHLTLNNVNYITKMNDTNLGYYYTISSSVGMNTIEESYTGLAGLTNNVIGYQNITSTGGSYCFWAKPHQSIIIYNESISSNTASNSDQRFLILPEYDINNVFYGVSLGTNGVQLYMRKGSVFCPVLTWTADLSNWNHFTFIIDSTGKPSFYLNGVYIKSTNFIPSGDRFLGLHLGTDVSGMRYTYAGDFTDICMFNKILSLNDINRIMYSNLKFKVAGTVLDSMGNVKNSMIRCYSHETGNMLGECVTDVNGNYVLIASSNNRSYVVCLPVEQDDISSEGMIYTNVIPSL